MKTRLSVLHVYFIVYYRYTNPYHTGSYTNLTLSTYVKKSDYVQNNHIIVTD